MSEMVSEVAERSKSGKLRAYSKRFSKSR